MATLDFIGNPNIRNILFMAERSAASTTGAGASY